MVYDLQLIENSYGDKIPIEIKDENGDLDDLTIYTNVRLVICSIDYSTNLLNKTQADNEVDLTDGAVGIVYYAPTSTNKVPAAGEYYLQVFRETASLNRPVRQFSLLITKEAKKS